MRRYLLLATIAFSLSTHAQIGGFTGFKNKKCNQGHKCKLKFAFNENNKSYTFKSAEVGLSEPSNLADKPLEVSFIKVLDKEKDVIIVAAFTGEVKDCSNKDSYVSLLLDNGNRIKLKCISASKDCHQNYLMVNLTDGDYSSLTESPINKVRLHYVSKEEDFDVDTRGQVKFIETLKCIDTAEN